jgi:ribosome-associated heat shock protein Hsp15
VLEQRLDKWLWCVRLAKTRPLAVELIASGKVRINGERVSKPARAVQPGNVLTVAASGKLSVVRVLGFVPRRVSAAIALTLYEDLTPRPEPAADGTAKRAGRAGPRPTKRDRRRIDAIRGS